MTDEIRVSRPIDREEMDTMLVKYQQMALDGEAEAQALRLRIVAGQRLANDPQYSDEQIAAISQKLADLRTALRRAEWAAMIGAALATANAVALVLAENPIGWTPPAGSLARVYMPGACDVTVKIDTYQQPEAAPSA